jgi:hypothetical protein
MRKKYKINKKLLEKMYIQNKFSCRKIAEELKINSSETVRYWLRKYKIKRRNLSESRTKYVKISFYGGMKEKAYLLGLRVGDIHARMNHNMIRVESGTSHSSQLKMFRIVFEKYSHVHVYLNRHQEWFEWNMYCDLDKSFDFLLVKPIRVPSWISENDDLFFSFLAGYADCEAGIDIGKNNVNNIRFVFRLRTSDLKILNQIQNKLNEKGIYATLNLEKVKGEKTNFGKHNKDFWCLAVQRKVDVAKLSSLLLKNSKHYEKIRKMKLVLKYFKETSWNKVANEVTKMRKIIHSEVLDSLKNLEFGGENNRIGSSSE